jgi:hypothetical protein
VAVAPTVIAGVGRGAQPGAFATPVLPFAPTLDRVFTASDTLRVYVEGTTRSTAGVVASLDIVNADGKVVASHSPSFTSGDRVRVTGDVPLQGLPPGPYLLRVTLRGAGQAAVQESGFAVR